MTPHAFCGKINAKPVTITPLKSFDIPENVVKIGDYCFANCQELTSIKGIENVKKLGIDCFHNCSKINKKKYPLIHESMFRQCKSLFTTFVIYSEHRGAYII